MFKSFFILFVIILFSNFPLEAVCNFSGRGNCCYYNYDLYGLYYGYQDLYTYPNGYGLPVNCCFPYYQKCCSSYRDTFYSKRVKNCSAIRPFTRERNPQ